MASNTVDKVPKNITGEVVNLSLLKILNGIYITSNLFVKNLITKRCKAAVNS